MTLTPLLQPLSGPGWKFRKRGTRLWAPAVVPGCVHRDLRQLGQIPDPFWGTNERSLAWIDESDWEYILRFEVGESLRAHEHIELVADGLDTVATVTLNGVDLARTENMFVTHRWPVRHLLRRRNCLLVRFASPTAYVRSHRRSHRPREINDPVGGCTRLRKMQCAFGWDWGPRLPSCGIWRPITLCGSSAARIKTVRVEQVRKGRKIILALKPELTGKPNRPNSWVVALARQGREVARSDTLRLTVTEPELWWPNGQGGQPLYTLTVQYRIGVDVIDTWSRQIGLRQIELDCSPDRWGESFQFRVNGRAIFAKGANWIPAHAFPGALTRRDYEPLLRSAAAAHMNLIRVWGGGVYEADEFYDLCDELGLLVWQDFMFACTLYPGDRAFLRSVATEAIQQVTRLRHHASLALWCGNNEIELLNRKELAEFPRLRRDHDALFRGLLPAVVRAHDPATAYWVSSPSGSQLKRELKSAPQLAGDWHDWDVWHARHPVKFYEQSRARFVSEFGMQSLSSPQTAATFCPASERNLFSPVMESHQKNPAGNAVMLDYISRRYRFPRNHAGLAYLSQLNQVYCLKTAVEHWRRQQPRTMGALYWQLNDCWPVASWSSLEFGGKWKLLHFAARRFFAPALVSAHLSGDEVRGIGNWLRSTVGRVELFTVYDAPERAVGLLRWELRHLHRRQILRYGGQRVRLIGGQSRLRARLDFSRELARHGADNLLLRISLEVNGATVSEDVVLFTAPKHLALAHRPTTTTIRRLANGDWLVRFHASVYQHQVMFDLGPESFAASDNGFDLLPGLPREVVVTASQLSTRAGFQRLLAIRSLADTY